MGLGQCPLLQEVGSRKIPGSGTRDRESRAPQLAGVKHTCCQRGDSPGREASECSKKSPSSTESHRHTGTQATGNLGTQGDSPLDAAMVIS